MHTTREGHRANRRRVLAIAAGVVAGFAMATAVARPATTAARTALPSPPSYTFPIAFKVVPGNQQGLAFSPGRHYVTLADRGGMARIAVYDTRGRLVKVTRQLGLDHAAEASVRLSTGRLYVSTGGIHGEPTYVRVVDVAAERVLRTLDLRSLGPNGLVAVDNANDRLVVFAGPNGGPFRITAVSMTGRIGDSFWLANEGVPQGLEVVGREIVLYTTLPGTVANRLTVYAPSGRVLRRIHVPIATEGEGLSVDDATGQIYLGMHSPNRVLRVEVASP